MAQWLPPIERPNNLRIFIPNEGEIEVYESDSRLLQDDLDVTDFRPFDSFEERFIHSLRYIAGWFTVVVNSTEIEKILQANEKWQRRLYQRTVWVFNRKDSNLFQAIVEYVKLATIAPDIYGDHRVDFLRGEFRSYGPIQIIPNNIVSHLPMIVCFEQTMPYSLGMYRDWAIEVGWQEKEKELTEVLLKSVQQSDSNSD